VGSTEFDGLHAGIAAPMIYQGQPVGLVLALKQQPGFYSDQDAQAAMAIENARLYAETRRRAQQLEAVSQVSQKLISILEMDQLLVEVVRLIREKLGHYHVDLFLVDGSSNEIVLRESSGKATEKAQLDLPQLALRRHHERPPAPRGRSVWDSERRGPG
jgi:GAF domain-containing protein